MVASSFVDPLLLQAIPESARADAKVAMGALGPPRFLTRAVLIQDTNHHVGFYPDIRVQGEVVRVPYRISHKWPSKERTKDFSRTQLLILDCWLSRHNNGKLRQKALSRILKTDVDVAWTIPFVIQLCGEYVIEIGSDVLAFVTDSLPMRPSLQRDYAQFVRDNPEFMSITRQRTVSYWLAYHRWELPQDQYPPFRAVETLAALASEPLPVSQPGTGPV
jgi:hypothetical protein